MILEGLVIDSRVETHTLQKSMSDIRDLFPAYTADCCVYDWVAGEFAMPVDHLDPLPVNCSHTSLLLFSYRSRIRRFCVRFVHHKLFKFFMLFVILLNAVALALRDPGLTNNKPLQTGLDIADFLFVSFFALEMLLKIISFGLIMHPKSYLRHPWNILDGIVVVSGIIGLAVNSGNGVSVLRVIRILRPLRAFHYVKTLRRQITRIIAALPRLRDVFVLLLFMVWLFDIIGVHLFMGMLNAQCFADVTNSSYETSNFTGLRLVQNDSNVCGSSSPGRLCVTNGVTLPQVCLADVSQSTPTAYSFDNAVYGFLLTFKIVCKDNWPDNLKDLTHAAGPIVFIYFLLATMFVGYFSVNLFLAIFENVFTSKGGDDDLTDRGKGVSFASTLGAQASRDLVMFTVFALPLDARHGQDHEALPGGVAAAAVAQQHKTFADALNIEDDEEEDQLDLLAGDDREETFLEKLLKKKGWRRTRRIVNSVPYTLLIILMVVFNAVVLGMDRLNNPPDVDKFISISTYILSILFIVDAVLKVSGLGPSYFANWMNLVDFALCIISIPDIANGNNSKFTALRAFRVIRLLRVAQGWEELQLHLRCLVGCILSVGSLCLLAFIIIYIYAILGFQLFGYDVPGQRFSFNTVFDSLVTVFVCVTGENQDNIADAIIQSTGLWSALYFVSLTLFGNFLLVTMFVAVILENFHRGIEEDRRLKEQSEHFRAIDAAAEQGFADADAQRAAMRRQLQRRLVIEPVDDVSDSDVDNDNELQKWNDDDGPSGESSNEGGTFTAEEGGPQHRPGETTTDDAEDRPFADSGAFTRTKESHDPTATVHVMMPHPSFTRRTSTGSAASSRQASVYLEAAQQIEQNLSLKGMADIFQAFAKDAGLKKGSQIVGDCSALATASEQQVGALRQEQLRLSTSNRTNFAVRFAVGQFAKLRRIQQSANPIASPNGESDRMHLASFSRLTRIKTIAEKNSKLNLWQGRNSSSLFCNIPPTNKLRLKIGQMLKHSAAEWCLLLVTIVSSVFLGLDNNTLPQSKPEVAKLVTISDIIFVSIFWVEMLLKIFVLGVFRHPGAFFRSVWNCIDALVTFTSFVALFYSPFKVFRALRVLRLLNLSFTLRVILSSIVASLPGMASVLVMLSILFLVYGVLGVALFQGYLRQCNDPFIINEFDCVGSYMAVENDAFSTYLVNTTRVWALANPSSSFDDIEHALYTLFKVSNSDNWFSVMYPIVDSASAHLTNVRNASPGNAVYFITFVILANFFTVKLFIGVMVEKFVENRERGQGHSLLTAAQRQWILVQKVELRVEVRGVPIRPKSFRILGIAFDIATSVWFDTFFTVLIVANSVLISAYYYNMPASVRNAFDTASIVFVTLFAVEITIKIMAFGFIDFMRNQWNRVDFAVVLLSIVGLIIGQEVAVVRVFRVSRLLLLLRKMKGLQTLFVTFYHALPEFGNVAFVLVVLYFIFAVVGVALFSSIPKNGAFDDVTNFDDVLRAFITLYVMMTQESWEDIADGMAVSSSYAYPFTVVFMILVSWIFVNLLVTVVVDVFGEAEQTERLESSLSILDRFRQSWVRYDPHGTRVLPSGTVEKLLATLPSAVWDRSGVNALSARRVTPWLSILQQLTKLHIPIDANLHVRYEDCIASVALRLFSITVFEGIDVSQRTIHGVMWKGQHFSIHHQFAAKLLTRKVRQHLQSRRERELETQLRLLREEHATFVQVELNPLRRSHQETTLLAMWLAQKLKRERRRHSLPRATSGSQLSALRSAAAAHREGHETPPTVESCFGSPVDRDGGVGVTFQSAMEK